jgi:hypothetical protein
MKKMVFEYYHGKCVSKKFQLCFKMGWRHKVELDEGIRLAYEDFVRMLGEKEKTGRF